ncbi:hypothetical protein M3172_23575 [Mesobacillus subterraneus]|uniref:hypothetical protein n=1 Tax=Mesobacillus subterraneus TaxID=285983 RepID=UPI00203F43DD|nr:hypothetical protein [Mesobacillus subterraneus]MCM3576155.1 hypothetical protein [Mesobacillus subterraneus]
MGEKIDLAKVLDIEAALAVLDISLEDIQRQNQVSEEGFLPLYKCQEHPQVHLTLERLKKLANNGYLLKKATKQSVVFSLNDAITLSLCFEVFNEQFILLSSVLKHIGYPKKVSLSNLHQNFIELQKEGIFTLYQVPLYKADTLLLTKKELDQFMVDHISVKEAIDIYKVNRNYFTADAVIPVHRIVKTQEGMFVNKKFVEAEMYNRGRGKTYTRPQAMKVLDLAIDAFKEVIKEFELEVLPNNVGFDKKAIDDLATEQLRIIKDIEENYYTSAEVAELFGFKNRLTPSDLKRLGKTDIPSIARTNKGKYPFKNMAFNASLISKDKVDAELKVRKLKDSIQNTIYSTPYETFRNALEVGELYFSENAKETEKEWFTYIKRKFSKSNQSPGKMQDTLVKTVSTTELLIQLTTDKELMSLSENEINLSIFNEFHTKGVKQTIYSFLLDLNREQRKKKEPHYWNQRRLLNPYKEKVEHKEKTIYSVDEYLDLIEYANRVDTHIKKSIEDISRMDQTSRYASTWLYVLIHLTNGWRHYDVATVPRINLQQTTLHQKDVKWLLINELTERDMDIILSQMQAKVLVHSKTGKRRYFFYSQELREAFAYAFAVCELRCQESTPMSDSLIDFTGRGKVLTSSSHKAFFKGMEDFQFGSLKMNRTVISYIYSIVKKKTNRNPLEFTKILRSHSDAEITSIYTDIPQEHIDLITSQLFNLGLFGYAYTLLANLLDTTLSENQNKETTREKALEIKSTFDDILQIEMFTKYLTNLEAKNFERQALKDYLSSLPQEEIENTYQTLKLGLQPSNEEGKSCIFALCVFNNERSCGKCEYSIHHIVSLSVLGNRFKEKVFHFTERFENAQTDGERTFLVNTFYGDIQLIKSAVETFGDDVVNQFIIDTDLDDLRSRVGRIESKKEYFTLKG